ncbi:hypothetical protein CYMTET_47596 [Cymbomonas tetramitiformis]|uniref:Secreted protein n=1 Tax=Cymbomonas tetramitiformis TaxID=36881 RepID=A0AAE0BU06_9CHLO|nr:hypothetical protein CYMTET_47596 [Cymbomonas tetramitiformis]
MWRTLGIVLVVAPGVRDFLERCAIGDDNLLPEHLDQLCNGNTTEQGRQSPKTCVIVHDPGFGINVGGEEDGGEELVLDYLTAHGDGLDEEACV